MQIILFEDEGVARFRPLIHLKPIYELTCGISLLREKFESQIGSVSLHMRSTLTEVWRESLPNHPINTFDSDDVLFINGRIICDDAFASKIKSNYFETGKAYFNGGQLAAFRTNPRTLFETADHELSIPEIIEAKVIGEKLPSIQIDCTYIGFMWDLIRLHSQEFTRESKQRKQFGQIHGTVHPSAVLVNEKNIFIGEGAQIKAGVVLDATEGFIYISKNASVLPNAVLMNNIFLGEGAIVKIGAKIYDHVYVGKKSKVGGEVESSIIESFANKQHEGFLGHSYISSWCNLGADTNTSDLKNNYSPVRMRVGEKEIDTKMQFLGLIMGEHSKSGINTMFNTGTVVGLSSNIFGGGFPPKHIGSFAWGSTDFNLLHGGMVKFDIDKALEVIRAVMKRRSIETTEAYERLVRSVFHSEIELKHH